MAEWDPETPAEDTQTYSPYASIAACRGTVLGHDILIEFTGGSYDAETVGEQLVLEEVFGYTPD